MIGIATCGGGKIFDCSHWFANTADVFRSKILPASSILSKPTSSSPMAATIHCNYPTDRAPILTGGYILRRKSLANFHKLIVNPHHILFCRLAGLRINSPNLSQLTWTTKAHDNEQPAEPGSWHSAPCRSTRRPEPEACVWVPEKLHRLGTSSI